MNRPFVCLAAGVACVSLATLQGWAQNADPSAQAGTPSAAKAPPSVHVVDATSEQGESLVSMTFDETPLADVIKAFRDATGANIISSGTNLQGNVSVRLDNVPWRKGLTSILAPQNLQLIEQPPNSHIYVVTAKTVEIPLLTKTFTLAYAKAEDVAKLLLTTIGKSGQATPFPSANAVIVTAPEKEIAECEQIITTIDKPRPQVFIEARFMELSAAASKKLGMKWDSLSEWGAGIKNLSGGMEYNTGKVGTYKPGTVSYVEGAEPTDASYSGYKKIAVPDVLVPDALVAADGAGRSANSMAWRQARGIGGQLSASDFSLTLSAFEQMDGVSVFSNPKIIVANEEVANVDMTTKEPNVEVKATRSGTQSDQLDITTQLTTIPGKNEPFVGEAFFSYGISLKVKPRVSSSDVITVDIEPSISEFQNYFEITSSQDTPTAKYPIIKMSRIKTVFTMKSGSTAVIGGLSRTTENNTDSGIPGLRKIPWIGPRLFGWKSREKEQKEIVIFVTVGIADPDQLKEDVGMPKNAILSRDILSGKTKEPGDLTKEEFLTLDDPKRQKKTEKKQPPSAAKPAQPVAPPEPAKEKPVAAAPSKEPADEAPLLNP